MKRQLNTNENKKKRKKAGFWFLMPLAIAGGTSAICLPLTICHNKQNHIPADAFHINSLIDSKYIVPTGTIIYTSEGPITYTMGNTLLDLQKFKDELSITTDNFVIDDEITFGILVGLNQNINLYENINGLMNIVNDGTNRYSYGIIVGSLSPLSAGLYTGNMYIDTSVRLNMFANTGFRVNMSGVFINEPATSYTQVISGIFTVFNSSTVGDSAGVTIVTSDTNSTQTIGGIFNIYGTNSATGFRCLLLCGGNTNISGVFNIKSGGDTGGVTMGMLDGMMVVSGIFTISGSRIASGVIINNSRSGRGSINISGVFAISSNGDCYGLDVGGTSTNNISASGTFTLFDSQGTNECFGIDLGSSHSGTLSQQPQFYSNRIDSGNWIASGGIEKWNGDANGTIDDTALSIQSIYDTGLESTANFCVDIISQARTENNKSNFNGIVKKQLQYYINHQKYPNIGTAWLKSIIKQI